MTGNWWLADPLTALGGADWKTDLKHVTAADNVHFTGSGYSKIAGEIAAGFKKLTEKSATSAEKTLTYYWRGFTSENGAPGPRRGVGGGGPHGGQHGGRGGGGRGRGVDGRGRRPHPYARQ